MEASMPKSNRDSIVPEIFVHDGPGALAFYKRAFGAEERDGTGNACCAAEVAGAVAPTGIATSESSAGRLKAQRPRLATLAAPTTQPTKKPSVSGKVLRSFFAASSRVHGPGQTRASRPMTKLATLPVIVEVVEPWWSETRTNAF